MSFPLEEQGLAWEGTPSIHLDGAGYGEHHPRKVKLDQEGLSEPLGISHGYRDYGLGRLPETPFQYSSRQRKKACLCTWPHLQKRKLRPGRCGGGPKTADTPLRLPFKHPPLPPESPTTTIAGRPLPSRGQLTCPCNSGGRVVELEQRGTGRAPLCGAPHPTAPSASSRGRQTGPRLPHRELSV